MPGACGPVPETPSPATSANHVVQPSIEAEIDDKAADSSVTVGSNGRRTIRSEAVADGVDAEGDWVRGCPFPSQTPAGLIGMTRESAVARYGAAQMETDFVLGKTNDLGRMSLRRVLSNEADLARTVHEMEWVDDGCSLVLWLTDRGDGERVFAAELGLAGGES